MTGLKRTLYLVLVLVIALVACSRKELEVREELSTPEKTYRLWLETAEQGDIPGNMGCITEASKRIVDRQVRQMDEFMKRLGENVRVFKTYTLVESRMKDEEAVVILKGEKGDIIVVPLAKEADGWKIDLVALFSGMGS